MNEIYKLDTVIDYYDQPNIVLLKRSNRTYLGLLNKEDTYLTVPLYKGILDMFMGGKIDLLETIELGKHRGWFFTSIVDNDQEYVKHSDVSYGTIPDEYLPLKGYFITPKTQ